MHSLVGISECWCFFCWAPGWQLPELAAALLTLLAKPVYRRDGCVAHMNSTIVSVQVSVSATAQCYGFSGQMLDVEEAPGSALK
jgi:hypothetical protein